MARQIRAAGAIGDVVQAVGMGLHRLKRAIRPAGFFNRTRSGGILVDIASRQIDPFLVFTGAADGEVTHAAFGHHGTQTAPDFDDFGEIALRSRPGDRRGYVRVDWFMPDGLSPWGDGRLFILGTTGSSEIRK